MKNEKEQTGSTKLRIIMSRHGEGFHNVAGSKISQIWKDKVGEMRKLITEEFGDTPETNKLIDNLTNEYKKRRDDIAYNLLETIDAKKYKDPSLTEKGKIQASYSGKALQAYADKKELQLSPLVFSSPFARTIDSLEEVLQNIEESKHERFVIPDFMETSGRYVDTYDEDKNYDGYTVLGEGINVQVVMKGGESEEQVVERSKRGLEKVFNQLKEKEEGLPIVMIHGGVMTAFSDEFFKGAVGKINNSDLWDLEVCFDESGKFTHANLVEKIVMDDSLKQEFDESLGGLEPSEKLLETHDFSPIENGLSILVDELKKDIEKHILDNQKASIPSTQEQQSKSTHKDIRDLDALAKKPTAIATTPTAKKSANAIDRKRSHKKQKTT